MSFSQSMWQTRVQADPEWSGILVFVTKICIGDIFNYLFQLLLITSFSFYLAAITSV